MAALKGLRVIEMSTTAPAPAPFAGMVLADFGATVTRIDRVKTSASMESLCRGKQSVSIDVKSKMGSNIVRSLCRKADVLIEPFRPGVMERLGLGPEILMKENPKLVYARMTGFGQIGPYSKMAGHDVNYIATSGVLSAIGRYGENPLPPVNLLGDFAGGGLMCVLGILMALHERQNSGKGQVVDAAMVDGSAYVSSFLWLSRRLSGLWFGERGCNALDTGAPFYETYKTSDGKYMGVGAIEPLFYQQLLKGLNLTDKLSHQFDMQEWTNMKKKIAETFLTKTQKEWCTVFDGTDACVTPILSLDKAPHHPHNKERGTFFLTDEKQYVPSPAPKLSRTPAIPSKTSIPKVGSKTREVLAEAGYSKQEIDEFLSQGVIEEHEIKSKL